ncbi:MAG: helix-hairpin-helix domain-containing protein [Bacteroidetes bacterium]|nr:helix-hairpin-helix domain-containing protein [Bacteroidota bacterium]
MILRRNPNKFLISLLAFLLLFSVAGIAQVVDDPSNQNMIEKKIENLAETTSEDVDYTNILENLSFFQDHPLELNTADKDQLEQLLMLDEFQISNLLAHRERFGKFLSVYELQAVEGFDLPTIYRLLPYVKVTRDLNRLNISFRDMIKYSTNEMFLRVTQNIEEQKGFSPATEEELAASPNSRYLGSPQRVFARYRFRYGNYFSAGITAEKDAGEEFFKGSQKQGFDFMTAHFAVRNIGKLKSLNIGDYQAQFGQGLTFWSGFAFGKTADAMNVKRSAQGLKPYTSVNENLFLRGVATSWTLGKFEITAFGSDKKVNSNASAVDSVSQDIQAFSSFNLSGYHRTVSELQDKANLREQIYGSHIKFSRRRLELGLTGVSYNYSADLQRSNDPYNEFEFQGRKNTNLGVDYNYIYRNFNFFGEAARSINGGTAVTSGLIASLDPRFSLSMLYRNFSRDYHGIYTAAISEGSRNINEKGMYVGFVAKPIKYFTVSAFIDRWNYPWLKYLVDAPTNGYDGLIQVNYTPSKAVDMYFRYRDRNRPRNNSLDEEAVIDYPIGQLQKNYRFDIVYKISPSFRLRNRVELVRFSQPGLETQSGYMILQDIVYKPLSKPVSFSFRYALFDTDGYNTRIYAYENDVLYSFSIPAYYYKGSRTYLTLKYNLTRKIDLWFRYAQFFYANRSSTGSGLTEVQGPVRSDFRVQARISF